MKRRGGGGGQHSPHSGDKDGDRDSNSRLSHRGFGIFLHVILAQLLLTLVPGKRKVCVWEGQHSPRRPHRWTDTWTEPPSPPEVLQPPSAGAILVQHHVIDVGSCEEEEGGDFAPPGGWCRGAVWACSALGMGGDRPRGEMGGQRGDSGLPSISSAREQGVAVEDGANNSGKTTRG